MASDQPPTYIDSHCHFDFDAFAHDRRDIWARCARGGVTGLVIPGVCSDQWPRAAKLAAELASAHFGIGLHPWWLAAMDTRPEPLHAALREALDQFRPAAVGEFGLDKLIDTPMQTQEAVAAVHLRLAREYNLPVIIHCVRAHERLLALLKAHPVPRGGVIHAFSGAPQVAEQYWQKGFRLGIGGTITYPRASKTRRAVQALPLSALLLETDAPDMPLHGRQGQRNSPEHLPEVARTLAELRDEPLADIARQTTANVRALFGSLEVDSGGP